jgi:hypothetical protein
MTPLMVQAGLDGAQNLADSFHVARATGGEAPQAVYVNRELDLDVWQLADKVSCSLPGSAVHLCPFEVATHWWALKEDIRSKQALVGTWAQHGIRVVSDGGKFTLRDRQPQDASS